MNTFVTYLTIYSGNKLPPFYIGSTSLANIKKGYKGSVSSKKYKFIWITELKENPHLFKTNILSYHDTRSEAFEKEHFFQEKLDVVKSDLYINLHLAMSTNFSGELQKGIPKSEAHKKKIGLSNKGKSPHKGKKWGDYSKERVEKLPTLKLNFIEIQCPHCGKVGQYNNMKRWHFDKCKVITNITIPNTETQKKKISESLSKLKWWTNDIISVRSVDCPEGFRSGRIYKNK